MLSFQNHATSWSRASRRLHNQQEICPQVAVASHAALDARAMKRPTMRTAASRRQSSSRPQSQHCQPPPSPPAESPSPAGEGLGWAPKSSPWSHSSVRRTVAIRRVTRQQPALTKWRPFLVPRPPPLGRTKRTKRTPAKGGRRRTQP
jgi:hypothetical protein